MRPVRPLVLAAVAATSVGLALPATAAPSAPTAVDGLSARTVAQIDALAQAKRGLTATQKKVDSRLLTEAGQRSSRAAAAGVGHVATGVGHVATGIGNVAGATFSIDGSSCSTAAASPLVGLDHTFVGDLVGSLLAPDGTSVTLFARRGLDGNNVCRAVFDDAAARSITSVTSAEAPFTGTWRPETPLAALNGHSADGTWNFHVADGAALDVGSVRAFTLHVSGFVG